MQTKLKYFILPGIIFTVRNAQWVTLVILAAITILSLWPADDLPGVPGGDKFHHFIAYAGLVFPIALRRPKYWRIAILIFIVWSGLIELFQPHVNRYGEWLDWLANIGGIISGIILSQLILSLYRDSMANGNL